MNVVTEFIKEYALITKRRLQSLFISQPPTKWQKGERGIVYILQGLGEHFIFFTTIARALNERGFRIELISNLNSLRPVKEIAGLVVEDLKLKKIDSLFFLSHSKGGLVAKFILDNYPKINSKVIKSISIASPYGGSVLGYFRYLSAGELVPHSLLMTELASRTDNNHKIVALYPKKDNHVIPNSNLLLKGAKNICLPTIGHTLILEDPRTIEIIISELG